MFFLNNIFRHPKLLGILLAAVSFASFHLSISDAKEFRQFADAKPVTGEVVSIEKRPHSKLRRATIRWSERGIGTRQSELVVVRYKFSVGDRVEVLVNAADHSSIILREQLSNSRPMKIAGIEFDRTEFWVAVVLAVLALFTFFFVDAPRRDSED